MDQDKIPVAIQLQPGTGFLIAFKAAKYLFDRSPGLQIPTFAYWHQSTPIRKCAPAEYEAFPK